MAIVVIVIAQGASAQTVRTFAGYQISRLQTDGSMDNSYGLKPGLHLGATVELPLSKRFSFESGFLFNTKGSKFAPSREYNGKNIVMSGTLNLAYAEVPLAVRYYISTGKVKTFVFLGPYLGVGIRGRSRGTLASDSEVITTDANVWEKEDFIYNRIDYGLKGGFGVEVNRLSLQLFYSHGLRNLNDSFQKTNNIAMGISIGYRIK